jgi:hypothetical protein
MTDKMPVGEWIEVLNNDEWEKFLPLYIGQTHVFGICDGDDSVFSIGMEWRYPTNPIKELRENMLDDWRKQGIDYAYDDEDTYFPIGHYFDWLIQNGYIEVK